MSLNLSRKAGDITYGEDYLV